MEGNDLVVSPLEAEQKPERNVELERLIDERLPFVELSELLIEVDGWTHLGALRLVRTRRTLPADRRAICGTQPGSRGIDQRSESLSLEQRRGTWRGRDDALVRVAPLLQLAPDWRRFLTRVIREEDLTLLRAHEHSGRPLGDEAFLASLEQNLGRILRRQKPGPKVKREG